MLRSMTFCVCNLSLLQLIFLQSGAASPVQNVQVVPLALNGQGSSGTVVLPPTSVALGTGKRQPKGTTGNQAVSLIDQNDKVASSVANSSIGTNQLENTNRRNGNANPSNSINSPALDEEEKIKNLLAPIPTGKSFFDDKNATVNPTEDLQVASTVGLKETSDGNRNSSQTLPGSTEKSRTNSVAVGVSPAVRVLSEKPLISSNANSGNEESLAQGGKIEDSKEKPQDGSNGLANKKNGTSENGKVEVGKNKNLELQEGKSELSGKIRNSTGVEKEPTEVENNSVGKDVKVLVEKPTISASTQEEKSEATSSNQLTGDNSGAAPKKSQTELGTDSLNSTSNQDSRINLGEDAHDPRKGKADAQEKPSSPVALPTKAIEPLPIIQSLKDSEAGSEPKSTTAVAPKIPPPATISEKSVSDSPVTIEEGLEAQKVRMFGNTAANLNVIQANSTSTKKASGQEKPKAKDETSSLILFVGIAAAGITVLISVALLYAKLKQNKERKATEDSWSRTPTIPVEFGSGEGATEITTPCSPPMSISGKSHRSIPVSLPPPRGDEDLSGGKSLSRELSNRYRYPRSSGTRSYERESNFDSQYPGSNYNESEFYDNSRYRRTGESEPRGRNTYNRR